MTSVKEFSDRINKELSESTNFQDISSSSMVEVSELSFAIPIVLDDGSQFIIRIEKFQE